MGIQLSNNPAFKSVDLSGVTQAAQQSPLTSGAMSGGTTLPQSGGGNPSTSLYNAGTISKMGQNFANIGKATGQVQIPGPGVSGGGVWDDNLINKGPGPGGIGLGQHDPKNLTQDQRQWLWEQNGHKGQAPIGYGGEAPQKQIVNNAPTLTSFLPSFTPPPSPVPSATLQPKSASGATTIPQSTSTGGGVTGQAFQALTQAGNALSGLGNLTSLPSSVLSQITKQLTTPGLGIFSSPTPETQSNKPLVEGYNPGADTGGARDVLKPFAEGLPRFIGKGGELIASGGIGAAPEMGLKAGLEAIPGIARGVGNLVKPITGGIAGLLGLGASAPLNPQEGAFNPQTRQFGETTSQGDFKTAQKGTSPATSQNILGNIKGPDNIARAIVTGLNNPKQAENVIVGIASEEAKPIINSMIKTAASQGDMNTVHQLIGMFNGVQKQINFNNMIQQAVTALSAGFGVPNAPGVTAARLPMVQQGIGSGLESVPSAPQGFNQQQNAVQSMPVRLPTVEAQQNRPLLNPFMGA
ncbi:hypothetical protein M0R04_13550 [Candidatus Dojkabacteria bacterium]|jgi:hypothetical protein|nr:hypothetical protein [Candidatus Dojkabacteria bacterium]